MKVWLNVAQYDGGWYAAIITLDGKGETLKESDLYTKKISAVFEMRKYAKEKGYVIAWHNM